MKQTEMFPEKGVSETEYYRNKYLECLVEIDKIKKEIASLKAEVEKLREERMLLIEAVLGSEDSPGLYDTVTPDDVWSALQAERDLRRQQRKDLEREREANAKLREALEKIRDADRTITGKGSTSGDNEAWWLYGRYGAIALHALLAAKQDKGNNK